MAASLLLLLLLAPLLLLGTAAGQAQPQVPGCLWLWNASEGNFSVETKPEVLQANTTYLVTIKDDRNHSNSSGQYLLQALSPQNASVGQWVGTATGNCSSVDTAILNIPEETALWASPGSNLSSVQMRVYLSRPDNTTELKVFMLDRGAPSTSLPSTPSPNSVCRAGGSSLLSAVLLLLLTGSLLS